MATYRHCSVSLWRDPDDVPHCRILSPDKTEWRLISATLCGWRRYFVADQLLFMTCIREEEECYICLLMSWPVVHSHRHVSCQPWPSCLKCFVLDDNNTNTKFWLHCRRGWAVARVRPVHLMNVDQRQIATNSRTKPTNLSQSLGCCLLHPPSPYIITQPGSWYSFCHATDLHSVY